MYIVCSDLEGVFVPEVWINVADKTSIPELRRPLITGLHPVVSA